MLSLLLTCYSRLLWFNFLSTYLIFVSILILVFIFISPRGPARIRPFEDFHRMVKNQEPGEDNKDKDHNTKQVWEKQTDQEEESPETGRAPQGRPGEPLLTPALATAS